MAAITSTVGPSEVRVGQRVLILTGHTGYDTVTAVREAAGVTVVMLATRTPLFMLPGDRLAVIQP